MRRSGLTTSLQLVLLIAAVAGISDVIAGTTHYKWKDERGNTVYSDRPPPKGIDYEVSSTGTGLKRMVDAEEGAVPLEVKPSPGNEFTQVNAQEAERSKKNPELCSRARTNLEALSGSSKIKVRDEKGEVRYLTDEEVIVEREKARAQISVYCP